MDLKGRLVLLTGASSGLGPHLARLAGEGTPAVANALSKAIRRNRREIQVAPPGTVISARLGALVPGLAQAMMRRTGASSTPAEAVERQRVKR